MGGVFRSPLPHSKFQHPPPRLGAGWQQPRNADARPTAGTTVPTPNRSLPDRRDSRRTRLRAQLRQPHRPTLRISSLSPRSTTAARARRTPQHAVGWPWTCSTPHFGDPESEAPQQVGQMRQGCRQEATAPKTLLIRHRIVEVRSKCCLAIDRREADALEQVLSTCESAVVVVHANLCWRRRFDPAKRSIVPRRIAHRPSRSRTPPRLSRRLLRLGRLLRSRASLPAVEHA